MTWKRWRQTQAAQSCGSARTRMSAALTAVLATSCHSVQLSIAYPTPHCDEKLCSAPGPSCL